MKSSLGVRSIVLAVLSSIFHLPQTAFSGNSVPKPELTLLVFNYAGLSSSQVKEIRARVFFVFEDVGIRTTWLDCRPGVEGHSLPAACLQPLGLSKLGIRLLDQDTRPADSSHTALGHSYASETGGSLATVSCATIKRFSGGNQTSEIAFLGHVIAHEVGHLLLGPGAHSNEGIMKAHWIKTEMQQIAAARKGVLFSREQAERLKLCLALRQRSLENERVASQQM